MKSKTNKWNEQFTTSEIQTLKNNSNQHETRRMAKTKKQSGNMHKGLKTTKLPSKIVIMQTNCRTQKPRSVMVGVWSCMILILHKRPLHITPLPPYKQPHPTKFGAMIVVQGRNLGRLTGGGGRQLTNIIWIVNGKWSPRTLSGLINENQIGSGARTQTEPRKRVS